MEPITWELFEQQVAACRLCPLWGQIRNKVPGQGDRNAPLMLIGERPGQVEDEQGLAFVGPAGQLLTRMLAAIGLPRERVYICNVVKCRPPHNRVPTPAGNSLTALTFFASSSVVPVCVQSISFSIQA